MRPMRERTFGAVLYVPSLVALRGIWKSSWLSLNCRSGGPMIRFDRRATLALLCPHRVALGD